MINAIHKDFIIAMRTMVKTFSRFFAVETDATAMLALSCFYCRPVRAISTPNETYVCTLCFIPIS